MKNSISEIIFSELPGHNGNLGLITLNRPQVLNALNHEMFLALDENLAEWDKNRDIKAVIIQATEGRAFCAGGDIRSAYEKKLAKDPALYTFFADEYRMNSRIHHFSKPYIALLNGITMGGGVGISIHGSYRIATDRLVFSMPETNIGFYPDVGTTYVLSRLPHRVGYYLALTGARISYADCYALDIVQEVVAQESLPKIIQVLSQATIPDKSAVRGLINQFAISPPKSDLLQHQKEIETCFSKYSVEEIINALENSTSEWCQQTAEIIKTKSPTSLKVTLHALQKAEKLSYDECKQMEYYLTCHFLQGHEFFEGVRAAIIDKDQKPRWKPAILSEVTTEMIEQYFMPLTTVC